MKTIAKAPGTSTRRFTRIERQQIATFRDFYKAVYGCRPHHLDSASEEEILKASEELHSKFDKMEADPIGRKRLREEGWTIPEPVYSLGPRDLLRPAERPDNPKKLMRPCQVNVSREQIIPLIREVLAVDSDAVITIDNSERVFRVREQCIAPSKLRSKVAKRLRENVGRAGATLKGFRWIIQGADTCQLEVGLVPVKRYRIW